ncbi:PIG-L deacetylase family protein [Crenothrix sp.]|uniref:PIG-L deacetylase family protein n=1 Tax=Crenothrix sp. TaxID=3100433 RepID=UPI00374DC8E4
MDALTFTELDNIPLKPEHLVNCFGSTLIVAPHPDDESLGCGGVIALLRKYEQPVSILVLSDGTQSHPNSKKFPPQKLQALRETELLKAAALLGVAQENVSFFRFPDRQVPTSSSENFLQATKRVKQLLTSVKPQSIFVPWRRDPHPDHRAAFELIAAAKNKKHTVFEYPIWLYPTENPVDAPLKSEVSAFRLDITTVLKTKQQAIIAHASQITDLIDDDPAGFRIPPNVLQCFAVPYEIFFLNNA